MSSGPVTNLPSLIDWLQSLGEEPRVAPKRGGKVEPVPVPTETFGQFLGWTVAATLILVAVIMVNILIPQTSSFIYAAF